MKPDVKQQQVFRASCLRVLVKRLMAGHMTPRTHSMHHKVRSVFKLCTRKQPGNKLLPRGRKGGQQDNNLNNSIIPASVKR